MSIYRKGLACILFALLTSSAAAVLATPTEAAQTWWVDQSDPGCSDAGPGTELVPFCSIKPGATKALAGDTVVVRPGLYREEVTPKFSGAPGAPITYHADAPGALIQGTLDLSDAAGWSPTATTAWSRPYAPPSEPRQVFLDGVRLSAATSATETTVNSFFYDAVALVLYVDIGGGNPADGHAVEAGAFTYGFHVTGKSDIVIDGFEMRWQNASGIRIGTATAPASSITVQGTTTSYTASYGILVDTGTGSILIENNTVTHAGSVGIKFLNSTGVVARRNTSHHNGYHGMSLIGSNNNQIIGNTLYANIRLNTPTANGLDVNGTSSDNLIKGNTVFQNEDSGIQVYYGADRNLLVRNVSWKNGDHGFDSNHCTGTTYISNTSYGNYKDGFSVEGNSFDTTLWNNIAVDNGLTTNEYDLYVDPNSFTTLIDDYNIFWNSTPQTPIRVNNVRYLTLWSYAAATAQEAHGIGADPVFVDASSGDLHLSAGSSAIDAANAGVPGFSIEDHDGRLPVDMTSIWDKGAGTPSYADRGAYEYDAAPTLPLLVSPWAGPPPLAVFADASGSVDPDTTPIAFYTFDFGDGSAADPQLDSFATHTYQAAGTYTITVTVTDTGGLTSIATRSVTAGPSAPLPPVADGMVGGPPATFAPSRTIPGQIDVTYDATSCIGQKAIILYGNLGDYSGYQGCAQSDAGNAGTATIDASSLNNVWFNIIWTQAVPDGWVAGHPGYGSSGNASVPRTWNAAGFCGVTADNHGDATCTDNTPAATLTVTPDSGPAPLAVTADASASTDGDSTPIASFTFDFGDGTVVGPQSGATAPHTYTSAGTYTVTVTVTDTAALSSTATALVLVN